MRINLELIPNLAAEQPPDRHTERFCGYVPECLFDAADGGHADNAQAPEALLLQHASDLFDVARVLPQDKRLQILHSADRSEEHTSELQSLMRISYAVFCLKKKKQHKTTNAK